MPLDMNQILAAIAEDDFSEQDLEAVKEACDERIEELQEEATGVEDDESEEE